MSLLDIALDYCERGWSPVPIPYKAKKAILKGWPDLRITTETASRYFGEQRGNIGVILGTASNGLTDVDLDCNEAVRLAPHFLPPTEAVFGRDGRPRHRLYFTDLAGRSPKVDRYFDPIGPKDVEKAVLVELRVGPSEQTVFPGSTHMETGDPITWVSEGEPATVDGDMLRLQVARLAAASLLARYWPPQGRRNDAALVVGGFLSRCNRSNDEIRKFVTLVAQVAGDDEADKRGEEAQVPEGKKDVAGLTRLREVFPPEVANEVAKCFGYKEPSAVFIDKIKKLRTEPPVYHLTFREKTIEIVGNRIWHVRTFKEDYGDQMEIVPPTLSQKAWDDILRELMERAEFEDPPAGVSNDERFHELLEEFLDNKYKGAAIEDVFLGKPFYNEPRDQYFFKLRGLQAHLEQENAKPFCIESSGAIGERIRKLDGKATRRTIKGKSVALWVVPGASFQATPEVPLPKIPPKLRVI